MAISKWNTVVQQCLLRRTSIDDFSKSLGGQQTQVYDDLFKSLLECRWSFCIPGDPLVSLYLDTLLTSNYLKLSRALAILIQIWNVSHTAQTEKQANLFSNTIIPTVNDITTTLTSPKYSLHHSEVRASLILTSKWLTKVTQSAESSSVIHNLAEVLGILLASLSTTTSGIELLSEVRKDDSPNQSRKLVKVAIHSCDTLYPPISVPLMERFNAIEKHIAMFDNGPDQSSDMQALHFQMSIGETQIIPSQAATAICLEALIRKNTTVDDAVVFNYLAGRHNNDYASMFVDLLLSSFHNLRNEDIKPGIQTFINNKLPIILLTISTSSFGSFSTEELITTALEQESEESAGHPFLGIAVLHQLLSLDAATRLAGHDLQIGKLISKDNILSSQLKGTKLVEALLLNDGNAGTMSQVLLETIVLYSQSKETHHMKDIADAMIRKPESINMMAMFVRPIYWLSSLCTLLDDWKWDDIHGESQPVYDEFGSIFLFVLVCRTRLSLPISELGIRNKEGFVLKYLQTEGVEQTLQELNDTSQKCLGDWINAFYIAEGLSDELTTSCSPQEFYILIPTILRQSIIAFKSGKLSQDALKAGLEYLLEPFLLPSLVSALAWTRNIQLQEPETAEMITKILVKPPETIEAREIHQTILPASATKISLSSEQMQQNLLAGVGNILQQTTDLTRLQGPDITLQCLTKSLIQSSGQDFPLTIDKLATVICMLDTVRDTLRIQYNRIGVLLQKNDNLTAEATVHLYRRVESYTNLLIVHDMGNQFSIAPVINQNIEMVDQTQIDTINEVLDDAAALGNIDQNDGGLSMDDLYGLQNDNMGLGNLDDLDLDMF